MTDFGPGTSLQRQSELFDLEKSGGAPVPLTDGEKRALEDKVKALSILLRDKISAKYKLEVQFGKGRTSRGAPFAGVISGWLSGTKLHGGGDEKIYECPGEQCGALILPHQLGTAFRKTKSGDLDPLAAATCGECGRIWKAGEIIGERFLKLTEQNWAHAILRALRKLDMNADIYLKYHPTDIRYQTAMEMARDRGGEEVAKARKNRGLHIYPLSNIIKDTKHGSDLYRRIRAFINA